ncbi:unnamed protein product [[Actinomadura] parvosata subsp. kistnae]|nr:unnamed protein product [Actinomadura parvosata subsp. kistnae]
MRCGADDRTMFLMFPYARLATPAASLPGSFACDGLER